MAYEQRTKILTFDTFVKQYDFYCYARDYPDKVPILLVDRSPCVDPFFDPYACPQDRQPIISGLCRGIKNFHIGDQFLYVARIDHRVHLELAKRYDNLKEPSDWTPHYFGVAALRVTQVWETHAVASTDFAPRRYVVAPASTPYPPNLAHARLPSGAMARENCIVHTAKNDAHTPLTSTPEMWRKQLLAYHQRQVDWALRVAGCAVEYIDGREALQLDPAWAPVFTPDDWDDLQMTVSGRWISEEIAAPLRERIARGRH